MGTEAVELLVSPVGIEPTTNWLKASCSTTELRAPEPTPYGALPRAVNGRPNGRERSEIAGRLRRMLPIVAIPVERRKYQRVVLTRPLPGRLGGARVYVLDASLVGLRVAHQGTVPAAGSSCRVDFEWEGRLIELDCEVRRNALHKLAKEK